MKRLNWSTLKHMAVSPALLKWRVEHPRPDTPALRLGRAIHCRILEPKKFVNRWITTEPCSAQKKNGERCGSGGSLYDKGKWYCKVKGHAPKGSKEAPPDVEVLAPEELELAKICGQNVLNHKVAAEMLEGGKFEESVEWENPETGITCRGRLDCLKPSEVIDLKSSRKETPRQFELDAARNLYHGQIAWYHDGAMQAGRIPQDAANPAIIMVSTAEPYDVAVFAVTDPVLEAGRNLYRDLLRRYAECQTADYWPGIAPDLIGLDLPNWAEGMRVPETEEW